MDNISIRILGMQAVQQAIFNFNARLGERVNRLAVRKGANYMLKAIRVAAPVKTGRLKKAIKVKNSNINQIRKNGKTGVFITVAPGKSRTDQKGAWYGKFVEVGHNSGARTTGSQALSSRFTSSSRRSTVRDHRFVTKTYRKRGAGKQIPGQHFVLNTFNATANDALQIMVLAGEVATAELARELNLNVTGA